MEKDIENRIRRAVADGCEARSAYYSELGLPDNQQLGPVANQNRLKELETRIGKPLPPSYREFLSMYNGWRMVTAVMDLLSVEEILEGPREASIRKWQHQALESGDPVAGNALVIGDSLVTPTKLLLDPEVIDEWGEWGVVQHHKEEEIAYPSFLVWLEESVDEFREILQDEIEDGMD